MSRNLKSLNFLVIGFYVYAHTLSANPAEEIKCARTEKYNLTSELQQQKAIYIQKKQPQMVQKIDQCIQSIESAYASCVSTLNSAGATALGAGATGQMGQLQQYQMQEGYANGASQLSQQDKALNDACVQQYGNAQSKCNGFPSAQSHASKVQGLCSYDAQQAASNADNFDQIKDAAQQLTPNSPQQSPTASPNSTPPSSTSPIPTPSGYTSPTDFAKNLPDFKAPNTLIPLGANKTLSQDSEKNTKDSQPKSLIGYGVNETALTEATDNGSGDDFLKRQNSGAAAANPAQSNSALLGSSDSSDINSPSADGRGNRETDPSEGAAYASGSDSVGGGLAFSGGLSTPFDFNSNSMFEKLMEKSQNPNTPVVEKLVPSNALPMKSRFGAKENRNSNKAKSTSLSSLFKSKRSYNERRAPSSVSTEKAPDEESQSTSRSLAILLLLLITAGTGQLYKKILRA